ncbi:MAG: hypothetical protein KIS66_05640 [Fimbriimonadaceae bacterium]|nr:hypothetical protein [Fimbriimonadaceae bacterium]
MDTATTTLSGLADDALDEASDLALREVEAAPDEASAVEAYERVLFPCACERMRRVGRYLPTARLAFVPVGTQPYSPVLAVLANPAEDVTLLCTGHTRGYAERVAAAVAPERPRLRFAEIGDGTDTVRIAEVLLGQVASQGFPPRGAVVVDVTSGRKATTAALGAVAAVRGYRQAYIEGQPIPAHPRLMARERHVILADVRTLASDPDRESSIAALREGEFRLAGTLLERLIARSGASVADRNLLRAAQALEAWRTVRFAQAAKGLSRTSRDFPGLELPDDLVKALRTAGADPQGPVWKALVSDLAREARERRDVWAADRLSGLLEGRAGRKTPGIVPGEIGRRLAEVVERRQGR